MKTPNNRTINQTTVLIAMLVGISACGGGEDIDYERSSASITKENTEPAVEQNISQSNETTWIIDRALLNERRESPQKLRELRFWRHKSRDTGVYTGLRVGRVDKGSEVYRLGLRSYDIINSVNGIVVRNKLNVARVFASMDHETSFTVFITRKGKQLVLNYNITGES
jgi:type II secretory pathway component PulC